MRKIHVLLVALTLFFGCLPEEIIALWEDEHISSNQEIVGKWRLIETLISPGPIGTFQKVDREAYIEFYLDETFVSTEALCPTDSKDSNDEFTGTYDMAEKTIIPKDCNVETRLPFSLEGDILITSYPFCIEPCKFKYQKVED